MAIQAMENTGNEINLEEKNLSFYLQYLLTIEEFSSKIKISDNLR